MGYQSYYEDLGGSLVDVATSQRVSPRNRQPRSFRIQRNGEGDFSWVEEGLRPSSTHRKIPLLHHEDGGTRVVRYQETEVAPYRTCRPILEQYQAPVHSTVSDPYVWLAAKWVTYYILHFTIHIYIYTYSSVVLNQCLSTLRFVDDLTKKPQGT